jgi:hypothetical protein
MLRDHSSFKFRARTLVKCLVLSKSDLHGLSNSFKDDLEILKTHSIIRHLYLEQVPFIINDTNE